MQPPPNESPYSDVSDRAWRIARTSINMHFAIQDEHELGQLLDLVAGSKVVLELGTHLGGTFHALCWTADPHALCISVDMPGHQDTASHHDLISRAPSGQVIIQILGDTHDPQTLRKVKTALGDRKVDCLFIDADHRYEAVRADHEDYGPLVAPGGIIAFHDINRSWNDQPGCEVDRYWQDLLYEWAGSVEHWAFVHAQSYGIGAYRKPCPTS